MNRLDIIRSLLRSSVKTAHTKLRQFVTSSSLGIALGDAINRTIRLRDQQITAVAGKVSGIHAVTVKVLQGRIIVDAALGDQSQLVAALIPVSAIFAPHGAKDLAFRVEPPDALRNRVLADIAGAIASELANLIWGPLLFHKDRKASQAFVERDNDLFRIDLRTIPEVKSALRQKATTLAIDIIIVKKIFVEDGALCLKLGIQGSY